MALCERWAARRSPSRTISTEREASIGAAMWSWPEMLGLCRVDEECQKLRIKDQIFSLQQSVGH